MIQRGKALFMRIAGFFGSIRMGESNNDQRKKSESPSMCDKLIAEGRMHRLAVFQSQYASSVDGLGHIPKSPNGVST